MKEGKLGYSTVLGNSFRSLRREIAWTPSCWVSWVQNVYAKTSRDLCSSTCLETCLTTQICNCSNRTIVDSIIVNFSPVSHLSYILKNALTANRIIHHVYIHGCWLFVTERSLARPSTQTSKCFGRPLLNAGDSAFQSLVASHFFGMESYSLRIRI